MLRPGRTTNNGGIRKRKVRVRDHLLERDMSALRREPHVLPTLVSMLFDKEPMVRWRSVEALGDVSEHLAGEDVGKVKETLRRLFWSMNDESGGLVWMAPEAAGSILTRVPSLIEEFAPILLSSCRLEPFVAGVRWASMQIAGVRPDLIKGWIPELSASLESLDPYERVYTAAAILRSGGNGGDESMKRMFEDGNSIITYDLVSGELIETTVGRFLSTHSEVS